MCKASVSTTEGGGWTHFIITAQPAVCVMLTDDWFGFVTECGAEITVRHDNGFKSQLSVQLKRLFTSLPTEKLSKLSLKGKWQSLLKDKSLMIFVNPKIKITVQLYFPSVMRAVQKRTQSKASFWVCASIRKD